MIFIGAVAVNVSNKNIYEDIYSENYDKLWHQ
jgi:hypothetical protein